MHYHSKDGALNRMMGSEVVFQSPVVVSHTPTARPVLAGPAAEGGVLLRDGAALPLEVSFNCRYAGLAVVTIILPLVPHGQISVTIPKQCDGDTPAHLHGAKILGLHVGTSKEGSEIVRDGQTSPAYVAVATRKFAEHKVRSDEDTTTFWIRKTGMPMRALEVRTTRGRSNLRVCACAHREQFRARFRFAHVLTLLLHFLLVHVVFFVCVFSASDLHSQVDRERSRDARSAGELVRA